MDHLIKELNQEQRAAVQQIQGPLLVLAGAGTGKTKVITSRIAWMIHQGIPPSEIVAVSFTNKAAREMKERLSGMVGSRIANQAELSTFHSFALKLLRKYHKEAGLPKVFSIADEGLSSSYLREVLAEERLAEIIDLQTATEKIAYYKDHLFEDSSFEACTNIVDKTFIRRLFSSYNRKLRLYKTVDFDDLVYLAALLLKKHAGVRASVASRYKYLMVDEFQDTNQAQFELVRMLAGKESNVCVVGDDDQSIYSWRGAKGDVLFEFLETFAGAARVTLEQNYRCSPRILKAANAVILENKKRLAKTLWSRQPDRHPIQIHAADNERDEALFVVEQIEKLVRHEGSHSWHDAAILVRSNRQTAALEQAFTEKNIPYHVHGGTRFMDRSEIRDLLCYAKLAANERDIMSFLRVVNIPTRGVGTVTQEKIKIQFEAASKSSSCLRALEEMNLSNTKDFVEQWRTAQAMFAAATSPADLAAALRWCYENMGIRKQMREGASDAKQLAKRMDFVERIFAVIENLRLDEPTPIAVVDALHLDDTDRFEKRVDSSGHVQIMTIHASKGLEFPVVFIVGAEEGILPHDKCAATPEGVEEERRLFYVAVTRAKQHLFISHCGQRAGKQRRQPEFSERKLSRFLEAIPRDIIIETETDVTVKEERRQDATQRLFALLKPT